jgi:hypothetical protein
LLKEQLTKLINKNIINKITEALSDVINEDILDNKLYEYKNELVLLKIFKYNINYIRKNDPKDIKNQKILVFVNKLKELDTELKDEINLKIYYEIDSETKINLIDKIIEYYENNKIFINTSNISKKDLDKINYWWS